MLVLAFGLILAGAQQPGERAKHTERAQAAAPETATPSPEPQPTYKPYAKYNPDPCYRADNHDTADLCAQWRAAIAAEKAANEARIATIAAIVGTIFGLATVVGLTITIWQTNGALGEARRGNRLNLAIERRARREAKAAAVDQARSIRIAEANANAAAELVRISTDNSRRQLRAYLSVEALSVENFHHGSLPIFKIRIRNTGQTPAKEVRSNFRIQLAAGVSPDNYRMYFRTAGLHGVRSSSELGGNLFRTFEYPSGPMPFEFWEGFPHGTHTIVFAGVLSYRDIFGKRHLLTFRYFLDHEFDPISKGYIMLACATGNKGT